MLIFIYDAVVEMIVGCF